MATQESTPKGGRFFTSGSTIVKNGTSACNYPCAPSENYSTAAKNSSWDNAHTSNPSNRDERSGRQPSVLVQHAQRTGGSSDG